MSPVQHTARQWLTRIHELPRRGRTRIMNVCGGHERALTMAGLRGVLPRDIELIPGPGCPICICPEEDLYEAIQLAMHEAVTLVAFGDLMRVPINGPRNSPRTLAEAQAAGADIRPIASPLDASSLARREPQRQVVFFATGFETTTAPVAAMLAAGAPENLSLLVSARRTWPAVEMLLESGETEIDALIAPGHVATVMGPEEWRFVPERHHLPTAVAGFTPDSLLAGIHAALSQSIEGAARLDNCYTAVVRPGGNPTAQRYINEVMDIVDAMWRGVGVIAGSGYALRGRYREVDARLRFGAHGSTADRRRAGEMPPGCDCARVVLGSIYPDQCPLYGHGCTPHTPVGPCMVSDEGACRIWWAGGVRERRREAGAPEPP